MGTDSLHEAVHLAWILDSRADFDTGTYINHIRCHESHRRANGLRREAAREYHALASQALPRTQGEWKRECNTCAAVGVRHPGLDEDCVRVRCRSGHPIEILVVRQSGDPPDHESFRPEPRRVPGIVVAMKLRSGQSGSVSQAQDLVDQLRSKHA
jgi:hypothetical protein